MSSEWRELTFGDFVALQRGHDLPDQERQPGSVPILGSFGVTGYHNTVKAHGPGVTIGRSGASFGVAAYTDEDYWPLNTALYVTDFKGNHPKFVFYFMKSFDFSGFNTGSAQPSLNRNNLYPVRVLIPYPNEQKRIADLLGALDDRITLLRETNATLEAIAQALFKSWFVDFDPVRANAEAAAQGCANDATGRMPTASAAQANASVAEGRMPLATRQPENLDPATAALFPTRFTDSPLGLIPEGWKVARLGDVVQKITKGTTPTTLKRSFVDSGINFVKAESMDGNGGFIPEKFAFIDSETNSLLARSQLAAGDVLISIAGTIGRMAVMTKDHLPANTNQAVALIRPDQTVFPSGLIYRFLQRTESQTLMGERVVQAVQANLSLSSLSDMRTVVPPAEVVNQLYNSGLAQVDESIVHNRQRIQTLATLRDTLLPRLISGQLRLPEVTEPAYA